MADEVTFHLDGSVGIIALNDPPMNLFATELMEGLSAAIESAIASPARAVVICSQGPVFSAGAHVKIFENRSAAEAREMFEIYIPVIQKLEAANFPVVAAVHGLCLAAGLELALACDIIFAAQSARFSQVEAFIGATTFLGGAQRLALRCGDARAREIVFTADIYDAATFERWNIINRVVPDELLLQETMAFARKLAEGPTVAHAVTKKMIRTLNQHGLGAADDVLLSDSVKLFETEDMKGGVARVLQEGARNVRHGKKSFQGR